MLVVNLLGSGIAVSGLNGIEDMLFMPPDFTASSLKTGILKCVALQSKRRIYIWCYRNV